MGRTPRASAREALLANAALCGYGFARGRRARIGVARQPAEGSFAMSTSTIIVLVVIVVIVLWAISVYNGLVSMRQRVNQAYADIDVQLRQRHDLIPNLVETVKGYAAHERGTLEEVIKARNVAVAAQGPAQQAAAENMLSGALRQLFALSEAYPDLKANANFQQLQAEIADLENKIAASRRFFNNAVQEYNTGIQRFPAALFAGMFGFTQRDFFDLGPDRQAELQAPQVKF
jgi:LemA protein